MKDDAVYLQHILECIDGVIRNLQTLGQSVLKLSEPFKSSHPEVDWKSIVGLRNVLVHDYLGVSVTRVWEIVEQDLPVLKAKVLAVQGTKA